MTRSPHRIAQARAGLTLIELLASLAIVGTALVAGAAALGHLADRYASLDKSTSDVTRLVYARALLRELIAAASLTVQDDGVSFAGLDARWEGMPDDELTFTTLASTVVSAPSSRIRLHVKRSPNAVAGQLILDVTQHDGLLRTHVLMPNVVGLELEYLTAAGPAPQWNSSWVSETVLPIGVQVTAMHEGRGEILSQVSWPLFVAVKGAW